MMSNTQRAGAVTAGFTLMSTVIAWRVIHNWYVSAPLVLFYIILLVNTFFSVRCFSKITPYGAWSQHVTDAALLLAYIFLATQLGNPYRFLLAGAVLFAVATIKYVALLTMSAHTKLLTNKIIIDSLGTLACVLAVVVFPLNEPLTGWLWVTAFACANIYILMIKPLYIV